MVYAKLKAALRKAAVRSIEALVNAIAVTLATFSANERLNFSTAAGYDRVRSESALGGHFVGTMLDRLESDCSVPKQAMAKFYSSIIWNPKALSIALSCCVPSERRNLSPPPLPRLPSKRDSCLTRSG
jgi:hypothetical protein